jgi:hypothetical protein
MSASVGAAVSDTVFPMRAEACASGSWPSSSATAIVSAHRARRLRRPGDRGRLPAGVPAARGQRLDPLHALQRAEVRQVGSGDVPAGARGRGRRVQLAALPALPRDAHRHRGAAPDDELMGAGLHQSTSGGFLNIHADFTGHPHRASWRRRLNLLLYRTTTGTTRTAACSSSGTRAVQRCVRRIPMHRNRAVIFRTDPTSFHGYPEPLRCPPGITRKSLALTSSPRRGSFPRALRTECRARPATGCARPASTSTRWRCGSSTDESAGWGVSDRSAARS